MSLNLTDLNNLFNNASNDGTISNDTGAMICNNLNDTVLMGCNGLAIDEITATEVTLITALYDVSSSIEYSKLRNAVVEGQKEMLKALRGTKKKDEIMMAQWIFNNDITVLHSYLPITDAVNLDSSNYIPSGSTSLYDVLMYAMTSNLAYAELLKSSGTPVQSIIIVLTDGEDTSSKGTACDVKKIANDLLKTEQYVLAYAGVGKDDHNAVAKSIGFPSVIVTGATESEIRKIFRMMSESIISVSQNKVDPNAQNSFFTV